MDISLIDIPSMASLPVKNEIIDGKTFTFFQDWSDTANFIARTLYFTKEETDIRNFIWRIARTLGIAGTEHRYFHDESEQNFTENIANIIANQMGCFNSPVLINLGVKENAILSACFLLDIQDNMESIIQEQINEINIFRGGAGVGVNFSALRGEGEYLTRGGTSSGPLSFLKAMDTWSGVIKAGGKCLHPDQYIYTESGPIKVKDLTNKPNGFICISYDPPSKRFKLKRAFAYPSGKKQILKVITDKGEFLVSEDHPFKLSHGEAILAKNLKKGQSLFACSIDFSSQYLRLSLHDGNKGKEHIHRLVAKDIMGQNIENKTIHHKDKNIYNNQESNLEIMSRSEHSALHSNESVTNQTHVFQTVQFPHDAENNGMHSSSAFWTDTEKVEKYKQKQSFILKKRGDAAKMQDASCRQLMMNRAYSLINQGYNIDTFDLYIEARKKICKIGSKREILEAITRRFGNYENFITEVYSNNHKVISVQSLGEEETYSVEVTCPTLDDKSIQSGHNFVIWPNDSKVGNGVVVFNSRRAARLTSLDIDHPDIEKFINCKIKEDQIFRLLLKEGFSGGIEGEAAKSISFQNTNLTCNLTDDFMKAVEEDSSWELKGRVNSRVNRKVKAKDLFHQIAVAAWTVGEGAVFFVDTANKNNPFKERIIGTNACQPGWATVFTPDGIKTFNQIRIGEIIWSGRNWTYVIRKESRGIKEVRAYRTCKGTFYGTSDHQVVSLGNKIEVRKVRCIDISPKLPGLENSEENLSSYTILSDDFINEEEVFYITVDCLEHTYWTDGLLVSNCGEVTTPPNNACCLASVNLQKMPNTSILNDIVQNLTLGLDIIVEISGYPTEEIRRNSLLYRPLGLGVTGLGAMLAQQGIDYDSVEAHRLVTEIFHEINKTAWKTSFALGIEMGTNLGKYSLGKMYTFLHEKDLYPAMMDCIPRNCFVTSCPPIGTTGLIMDAESSGIEPIYSERTVKELSTGEKILQTLKCVEEGQKKGKQEFKTANGQYPLHWNDHLTMLKAIFDGGLSQNISKTVNLPNDVTIAEIEMIYLTAWKMGLKSLTVYRDGSKGIQPLTKEQKEVAKEAPIETQMQRRRRMPETRSAVNHKFKLGGKSCYISVGLFEDGTPGELFVTMDEEDEAIVRLLDCVAVLTSIALQYGVPLESIAYKMSKPKFPPNGFMEGDIKFARSIVDYIFKWMTNRWNEDFVKFVDISAAVKPLEGIEVKIVNQKEELKLLTSQYQTKLCPNCSSEIKLEGCSTCSKCGWSKGCAG
jgi:ribonucleotide reductase alpha subunit